MEQGIRDMLALRIKETYKEVYDMLEREHVCAMVRPTGFGKTHLMCKLANK